MRNRIVGIIIVSFSILIGFIVVMFNRAMTKIVDTSCTHGPACPMWDTIDVQTNIGIGIMIVVILIGLYLIFFGQDEKIITKVRTVHQQAEPRKLSKESLQKIMGTLDSEEKSVLEKVVEAQGTIFQSDLVEKTGFTKVKVTRILDKLEGRGIIERKRRGMTNVVILKNG